MALAVHHAHAALAPARGFAQEAQQGFTRLFTAQPVQVDLGLDRPVAAAQACRHVVTDAGAAKAQAVVGQQQRLDVDLVGPGLQQRRAFVRVALQRQRCGLGQADVGAVAGWQPGDRADRVGKQLPRAFGGGPLGAFAGFALGPFTLGAGQGVAQPAQALQAVGAQHGGR
jgi:hypothetical protein